MYQQPSTIIIVLNAVFSSCKKKKKKEDKIKSTMFKTIYLRLKKNSDRSERHFKYASLKIGWTMNSS